MYFIIIDGFITPCFMIYIYQRFIHIQLLRSVGWSFCRRECSFSSMRVGCICTYVCTTKFAMYSILVLTENNNSVWGLRTHQACLSAFGKYGDRVRFRDLRKFHENFSFCQMLSSKKKLHSSHSGVGDTGLTHSFIFIY